MDLKTNLFILYETNSNNSTNVVFNETNKMF